jgi:signal peptidase
MKLLHRRAAMASPASQPSTAQGAEAPAATPSAVVVRTRRPSLLVRIGGTLLTLVMAVALIIFVSMTVLRISGGELLAIRTGSMSPVMEPGDLLISRDVDPRTVRRGDVITFRVPSADNTLVTHRVTKVDKEGNSFTTKGDANDTVDPFTTKSKDVLGSRWFSIPKVGRIMVFLSSGLGTMLLIGIPAAIYLGQTLADRRALQRSRAMATVVTTTATATPTEPAATPSVPAATPSDPPLTPSGPPPCTLPPPAPAPAPTATPTPVAAPVPPPVSPVPPSAGAPGHPPVPLAVPTAHLPASVASQFPGEWVLVVPMQPSIPFPSPFPPPVPATPTKEYLS